MAGGDHDFLTKVERILHSKLAAGRTKDEPGVHQIEVALRVKGKLDG